MFEVVESGSVMVGYSTAPSLGSKDNVIELSVTVQLAGVAVSLIDNRPREVLNLLVSNVRFVYDDGTKETQYGVDIQRIQMDNMLYNALFPIVFWPKQAESTAFLHIAVNQAKGHEGIGQFLFRYFVYFLQMNKLGITFFNGVELVLQEADVRVDEGFVTHVLAALQEVFAEEAATDDDSDVVVEAVAVADYRKTKLATGDMVYARVLYIGPISLQVSYSSCPWAKVKKGRLSASFEREIFLLVLLFCFRFMYRATWARRLKTTWTIWMKSTESTSTWECSAWTMRFTLARL